MRIVRNNSRARRYVDAFLRGLDSPNNSHVAGFDPCFTVTPYGALLRSQGGTPYSSKSFQDETGYEAFINKLHLSGGSVIDRIRTAGQMAAVLELERSSAAADATFRVVVSTADDDVTWRFYTVRQGQHWIADDLELYEEEAIIVVDLAPSK